MQWVVELNRSIDPDQLPDGITIYAHNFKGYDGRLLYEEIVRTGCQVNNLMFRGSKIISFHYGQIKFSDTLLQLPASLEQLPKMFGMDETQFKKGYFPYLFNTPDNQDYVGPIPDKTFFQPEKMFAAKRKDFEEKWYPSQQGEYNFRRELEEYCISDVKILAKAIEAYLQVGLQHKPLDPWSCTTIASYALQMYRQYYMPEDQMAIL